MELHFKAINVHLQDTSAYKWTVTEHGCVRGYAYVGGSLLQGEALLTYLLNAATRNELEQMFSGLEGIYSIILELPFGIAACVDQARSLPLFYRTGNGPVELYDALEHHALSGASLDEDMVSVFQSSVFVPNDKTCFQNFYQIQTGHYAILSDGQVHQYPHFKMTYAETQITDIDEACQYLDKLYSQTFRRTVELLNGRTAVIPLSGGHDSRLVAFYLKERLGYSNIIAYSYGSPGNDEASYSEKVAEILGIPWHFVYSDPEEMRELYRTQAKDYLMMSGNGTSMPHLQEWYHVYKLKQRGVLPEDSVFVPGYPGDFTAGGFMWRDVAQIPCITPETIMEFRHRDEFRPYYLIGKRDVPRSEACIRAIRGCMCDEFPELQDSSRVFTPKEAALMIEQAVLNGWYSKFIANAVRVFDYFGYQWLMPFFERAQFDGWSKIDNTLRRHENGYFEFARRIYPQKLEDLGYSKAQSMDWAQMKEIIMKERPYYFNYTYGYFGADIEEDFYKGIAQNRLKGPGVYILEDYLRFLNEICK